MSKFTTEVRYIVDTLGDGDTIAERIASAAPKIFDDSWTTENPEYKNVLENKILRHYYMREIGAETVGLWILQLNTTLAEIMPKYNAIYSSLEKYKANLIGNIDVTETQDLTNNQKTAANSETTDHTAGTTNTTADSSTTGKSSATANADAWQEYNDTPQGALDGIETRKYLTNATRNRSSNDTGNNSENSGHSTGTNSSDSTTTSTGKSAGTADTTENYVKHIFGKNSGTDIMDSYLKLVQGYNDIDQLIINELNGCFINLWE